MAGDGMRLGSSAWRRAGPRLEPRPSLPERFLLDQCPDAAVALVIGICALGEIALAHLREVVRGVGEFEQCLEACEIRGSSLSQSCAIAPNFFGSLRETWYREGF